MERPAAILIPVNRLDRAKGRLSGLLSPDERRRLFLETMATVVEAAMGARSRVVVLTSDAVVASALPPRVEVVSERGGFGLNGELEAAIESLRTLEDVLVLHADLPLATADAIATVARAATTGPGIAMVESSDGGTNALLLRPPGVIRLAFGPGSCALHRAAAKAAGASVRMVDEPGLAIDLDTAADIVSLMALSEGRASRAGRLLLSMGVEARLEAG